MDIGTIFIAGVGQVKTATRLAIEAAKTMAENALPADEFSSWVTCDLEDWDFDPVDAFIPLTEMPDSLGTSILCLRKNQKECKKLNSKPDPKHTDRKPPENEDPKPTDKKYDDDGPKPTNSKPDDNKSNPMATKSAGSPSDTSSAIGKPGVRRRMLQYRCVG